MKLLIVAATKPEVSGLIRHFEELDQVQHRSPDNLGMFHDHGSRVHSYSIDNDTIDILVTGVGIMNTAFHMGRITGMRSYDLAINVGVAGSFLEEYEPGQLVNVMEEEMGDFGAEDQDVFLDIFELELMEPDRYPFTGKMLINPFDHKVDMVHFLPAVKGITVNKVHGNEASIERIMGKYNPAVESMEGAAFFYACLIAEMPFYEIRAISNYIERRNKNNWLLEKAITELNNYLIELTGELVNLRSHA